jgi:transposase
MHIQLTQPFTIYIAPNLLRPFDAELGHNLVVCAIKGYGCTLVKFEREFNKFLHFLRHIDANAYYYGQLRDPQARKLSSWFARRSRYHAHFTATYSSLLNQVETWFAVITGKAINRGSFRSIRELIEKTTTENLLWILLRLNQYS